MNTDMEKKSMSHIVRNKIKEVENSIIPGVKWDKQKSWNKIKEALNTKNKHLIMWYFASAASISILIASTTTTTLPYLKDLFELDQKVVSTLEAKKGEALKEVESSYRLPTKDLRFKELNPAVKKLAQVPCSLSRIEKSSDQNLKPDESELKIKEPKATGLYFEIQTGYNQIANFTPGISIDYRHIIGNNTTVTKYISMGVSTSFILTNKEGNNTKLYPATFVNAKYGQQHIKSAKNKAWEIGVGYLLNPDQTIYKDTTVRFQYTRTISGRLRIGPEFIFTDNLKKLYPGITLAFG